MGIRKFTLRHRECQDASDVTHDLRDYKDVKKQVIKGSFGPDHFHQEVTEHQDDFSLRVVSDSLLTAGGDGRRQKRQKDDARYENHIRLGEEPGGQRANEWSCLVIGNGQCPTPSSGTNGPVDHYYPAPPAAPGAPPKTEVEDDWFKQRRNKSIVVRRRCDWVK